MKKVLFLPEVVDQFLEVAEVLYQKGYLGFKEVAIEYSERLFRDIQTNLPQISIPLGMYSIVFMNKMGRLSFLSDI